ncbi:Glycyl-glycine endopeptidase ALE-1 precursor [Corynebacterium comes]|uniref:Glycyl-glycine endopeptidase ALE-1 n=2 Tax=Corynebacterium comes TaxID=2675218 RepID=A0A6B8VTQ3_9CORY|nr:M23 family metallopeptidase [Corynebacterium comes]QGU03371.1 Glycyl-glycine endopeptidase ALE-1 precursor [Corynebacterium comes]
MSYRRISTGRSTRNRIALMALTAGVVSSAGIGGAAAATLQAAPEAPTEAVEINYELASDDNLSLADAAEAAPQILAVPEIKPVDHLDEQLNKAIEFTAERAAAAQAEAEAAAAAVAAEAEAAAAAQAEAAATEVEVQLVAQSASVVSPAQGTFTSGFGPRWGTLHAGIDIANGIGTPILAIMDGTVINSGPASGYGQWIRIQHDDGSISVYGHMSTLGVSVGERVYAGQQIAGMGSEGFSTGSHLHFEIHPSGSGPVDPVGWFSQFGIYF